MVCRGEALLANLFCRVGSERRLGKHQKQYVTVSEPRRIPITTISQCSGDSSVALVPCVERLNVYPHAWSLEEGDCLVPGAGLEPARPILGILSQQTISAGKQKITLMRCIIELIARCTALWFLGIRML